MDDLKAIIHKKTPLEVEIVAKIDALGGKVEALKTRLKWWP